jgi:lauroyl/myristoyl acyltransferase
MDLQPLINSRLGVGTALGLGRILPSWFGYPFAKTIAGIITVRKSSKLVRSVRMNQWVVRGEHINQTELSQATLEVFNHSTRCLYDFYHSLRHPEEIRKLISLSPRAQALVERSIAGKEGAVIAGPHTSNFDLGLQALALNGLRAQVLSYPQPSKGYRWQNQMRSQYGLEVTPISLGALRTAGERLRSGGMIITGVERPIASQKYQVRFFGRQASLPVSHVQLALNTGVPVFVVGVTMLENQKYIVDASDPIELVSNRDRQAELVSNAEAILRVVESFIRRAPQQWLMFYPVWPGAMELVK